MKSNISKIITVSCALVLAFILGLTGFSLARPGAYGSAGRDRLVGVLVTTEYLDLFDFDSYLKDNIGSISGGDTIMSGDTPKYQGRLYATLTERSMTNEETGETYSSHEYVFEDVNGMSFFTYSVVNETGSYSSTSGDEAISAGHISVSDTDEGESITLEGTIYAAQTDGYASYYINPVYQSADGPVYAVSGSGFSFDQTGKGDLFSQTISETTGFTENGKIKTYSVSIKITVSAMSPPNRVSVLQFDPDGNILSRDDYLPGTLPKSLTPEPGCSYILLESFETSQDTAEGVTRSLYQPDDNMMESFCCREDGICIKQYTALNWNP